MFAFGGPGLSSISPALSSFTRDQCAGLLSPPGEKTDRELREVENRVV